MSDKLYYDTYIGQQKYCEVCGKETKFNGLQFGYSVCCSRYCSNHNPNRAKKIRETNRKEEVILKNVEKGKKTKLERYGDENYNNIEKGKRTKLERYGNENYNNRIKAKETYPRHTKEVIEKYRNTRSENQIEKYREKADYFNSVFLKYENGRLYFRCNTCSCEYSYARSSINNLIRYGIKNICLKCFSNVKTSRAENEIFDYVFSLDKKVEKNNHTVLDGKELDIYLPENKLAIEYDGLFWHNQNRDNGSMLN